MTEPTDKLIPEPPKIFPGAILTSGAILATNNATQEVKPAFLATCSPSLTHCCTKESCLKHHSDSEKEQQWTQVTGRRARFLHAGK